MRDREIILYICIMTVQSGKVMREPAGLGMERVVHVGGSIADDRVRRRIGAPRRILGEPAEPAIS